MDGSSWHCTAGRDPDQAQEKEMQKCKMLSEALQIADIMLCEFKVFSVI